jgi:hypothetical protein
MPGDGLTLYFASDRPGGYGPSALNTPWPFASYDMYVTHRRSLHSRWAPPVNLGPLLNTSGSEHSVTITPDGHYMFFASDRPGGCGMADVWMSYRSNTNSDFAWEAPQHIPCVEDGGINGPFIDACPFYHVNSETNQVEFYFIRATSPDPTTLDVMVVDFDLQTGQFGTAQPVPNISSQHNEGHLDPAHGYIWAIYPHPDGTFGGGSDIWISERGPDGWSFPYNLGPRINTPFEEQLPAPTPDGRTLFFPSDRPGGSGGLDIYEARFSGRRSH